MFDRDRDLFDNFDVEALQRGNVRWSIRQQTNLADLQVR